MKVWGIGVLLTGTNISTSWVVVIFFICRIGLSKSFVFTFIDLVFFSLMKQSSV